MAPDAVTIVGLVLGVLGLFGMSLMYDLSKQIWKLLVCIYQNVGAFVLMLRLRRKAGGILRPRNGARDEEGLPMTSAATQVRIRCSHSSHLLLMNRLLHKVRIGSREQPNNPP